MNQPDIQYQLASPPSKQMKGSHHWNYCDSGCEVSEVLRKQTGRYSDPLPTPALQFTTSKHFPNMRPTFKYTMPY